MNVMLYRKKLGSKKYSRWLIHNFPQFEHPFSDLYRYTVKEPCE